MKPPRLEDVIRKDPFQAFDIHTSGRVIPVSHPEQILLASDKSTAVVALANGHLEIIDVDRISSLTLRKRGVARASEKQ
jgi:hypothetical protein